MGIRRGEILAQLVSEEEDNVCGGGVEGEGGGEVGDALMGVGGGGRELDGMEGGPRHVSAVEGVEVGQFLEGSGLGLRVCGFDLAADLIDRFGDEGGLCARRAVADALDYVVDGMLEERGHQ